MFLGIYVQAYCQKTTYCSSAENHQLFLYCYHQDHKGSASQESERERLEKRLIRGQLWGSNIDIYFKMHQMATKAKKSSTHSRPSPKNKYTNKKSKLLKGGILIFLFYVRYAAPQIPLCQRMLGSKKGKLNRKSTHWRVSLADARCRVVVTGHNNPSRNNYIEGY